MSLPSKFADFSKRQQNLLKLAKNIQKEICRKFDELGRPVKIMHVCGTHEATVSRSGMRSLLPKELRIISGPGCPVCVCPSEHITTAIELANQGHIVVTFGDMFKVPDGRLKTLSQAKGDGGDIRVVYSVTDATKIARENPNRKVVWLGIGFETTAPMTSFILQQLPPDNFFVLSDFRLVPPAMEVLVNSPEFDLDGFIIPGHVTTVMGTTEYDVFAEVYNVPCVVGGFDPIDFMVAIDKIMDQILAGDPKIENAYPRAVRREGNQIAKASMEEVFSVVDAKWRGVGIVPKSGLELSEKYQKFDAQQLLKKPIEVTNDLPKGCRCGSVILGKAEPDECPHFLKRCTPETAIGPCMVSDEGTCRIRAIYQSIDLEIGN